MKQNLILPDAIAIIRGSEAYAYLQGQVKFYQRRNYVLVQAVIRGLPDTEAGFFGFHIHAVGSCTGSDFADTGSHYNPADAPHPSHAGDLPPLMYCNGNAYMSAATDRFNIADIFGRTVVIHSMPDDFRTQPAGNAGTKIACGVIRRI